MTMKLCLMLLRGTGEQRSVKIKAMCGAVVRVQHLTKIPALLSNASSHTCPEQSGKAISSAWALGFVWWM